MLVLYVTFWHIASMNLPLGSLLKRRLTIDEGRLLVDRAREDGQLVCVAKADLAAPYRQAEWKRHVELCHALAELSIRISIDDFFGDVSCNPLQLAAVGVGRDLLLIDNCYVVQDPPRPDYTASPDAGGRHGLMSWSSLFTIDPTTIQLDLYSAGAP
jgi:hypothetical protein